MRIGFDQDKRDKTLRERGLSFEDVVLLEWRKAAIEADSRKEYGEYRQIAFLPDVTGRMYVVGFTMRDDVFWIFSFRKANDREVKKYGEKITHR